MKMSRHVYMNEDAQERLERLKTRLGLSASGVVVVALKQLEETVNDD